MRQNKYQSPKDFKIGITSDMDALMSPDSTSPGRADHDLDSVSLLSNDDPSMMEEEMQMMLEGVAFGEDLSMEGDGYSVVESIANEDQKRGGQDGKDNDGYYDDSDAFAEDEIADIDTENEYGDEQFERSDSESPAGIGHGRTKQTRSMSSSPTTTPSGKQSAASQRSSEYKDRVRARKQDGGSSAVTVASTTAPTDNDGISVLSGGDLTAVLTTTSSSTQKPFAANEAASNTSTVIAGAKIPRTLSFTPSSTSSKSDALSVSSPPKKGSKSQNHLPPISPSPSKKQQVEKSTKGSDKMSTKGSSKRSTGHHSQASSRNNSGADMWGFEKTGISTRHNSKMENSNVAPIVNWNDGDDGNPISGDLWDGFRGKDVSRKMSFEEAAGSLEYLARLSQSQGPSRKSSSSHRAELTRMDREIRIYTVEMADNETVEDPSIHGGQDNSVTLEPFSPTSALSAGIVPGVSTYAVTPRESECRSFHTARSEIKCWLLMESKTLLIRVYVPDAFPLIDVQAHISLRDLALNKSMTVDTLLSDFKTLENIAKEIISEVELLIEDESAAAALAAKQRKNYIRSKSKTGDGMNQLEASTKDGENASNKNKPTRRTRLVVHMAHKGRRRHRSTAEAFLDEQFMSHLWSPDNDSAAVVSTIVTRVPSMKSSQKTKEMPRGTFDTINRSASMRRGSFNASLMKALHLQPILMVPVPERLEVTRNTMIQVSVTVPGPKSMAAARLTLRPSLTSSMSFSVSSSALALNFASLDALNFGATTPPVEVPIAVTPSLGDASISTALSESQFAGVTTKEITKENPPESQKHVRDHLSRASMTSIVGAQRMAKTMSPVIKQLPKKQTVPALVTLSTTKPGSSAAVIDKVSVVISFLASTTDNFNDKKAINIGDEVRFTAGLPSIMQADEEMILEFFDNLVEGLYVVHDSNTSTNTASIIAK